MSANVSVILIHENIALSTDSHKYFIKNKQILRWVCLTKMSAISILYSSTGQVSIYRLITTHCVCLALVFPSKPVCSGHHLRDHEMTASEFNLNPSTLNPTVLEYPVRQGEGRLRPLPESRGCSFLATGTVEERPRREIIYHSRLVRYPRKQPTTSSSSSAVRA